ncbi:MAG: hypothetical protein AB1547_08590 [Thermodesulfobacteriota bacterium]
MKPTDQDVLNRLFREQGDILGGARTTVVALECFIQSLRKLKTGPDRFYPEVLKMTGAIQKTEPPFTPLIHLIERFEQELERHHALPQEALRDQAIQILERQIDDFKATVRKVIDQGVSQVADGDVILVYSTSTVVNNILIRAKDVLRRQFRVIVLKQDMVKTRQLIRELAKADVPHEVIPEYVLDHVLDSANKLFIGALSITRDNKVIASAGTPNIVSLCHIHRVPVYLFLDTFRFSHRPSSVQTIPEKSTIRSMEHFDLKMKTRSHSILDLDLIEHVITEQGEMNRPRVPSSQSS